MSQVSCLWKHSCRIASAILEAQQSYFVRHSRVQPEKTARHQVQTRSFVTKPHIISSQSKFRIFLPERKWLHFAREMCKQLSSNFCKRVTQVQAWAIALMVVMALQIATVFCNLMKSTYVLSSMIMQLLWGHDNWSIMLSSSTNATTNAGNETNKIHLLVLRLLHHLQNPILISLQFPREMWCYLVKQAVEFDANQALDTCGEISIVCSRHFFKIGSMPMSPFRYSDSNSTLDTLNSEHVPMPHKIREIN